MDSTHSFSWRDPIHLDAAGLQAFAELADEFARQSVAHAAGLVGLSPNDLNSKEDVLRGYEETEFWKVPDDVRALANEFEKITKYKYDVKLKSGLNLTNIGMDQLLSLPNAPNNPIVQITTSNNSYIYGFSIDWNTDRDYLPTFVNLRGPFQLVDHFNSQITSRLMACTNVWKSAREFWPRFIVSASVAIVFAYATTGIDKKIANMIEPNDLAFRTGFVIFCSLTLAYVLTISIFSYLRDLIKSLVPLVEFRIGGGVERAANREGVRRIFFWTIPVLGIILPLLMAYLFKLFAG